jgi:hypothetical protein
MHTIFWLEILKGRPRCREEDNIRMDIREIRWEVVEWKHLPQDRDERWALVNTVINLRIS